MASKKKSAAASSQANLQTLRIGSRVRCSDDNVEGRIVWANAVSVKIEWTDGEKVTWKRDSLADRPIEILHPDAEQDQLAAPAAPPAEEPAGTEVPQAETAPTPEVPAAEPPPAAPATEPTAPVTLTEAAEAPAKPKRQRKAPAEPKEKKVSALDA